MRILPNTRAAASSGEERKLRDDLSKSGLDARLFQRGLLATNVWSDRYEVRRLLGRGGQCPVFELFDRQRGVSVAGKVLDVGRLRDWSEEERFRRQAAVLARLRHPLIPTYVDYLRDDDVAVSVLVMEYIAGETLEQHRERTGAIGNGHAGWIMADVLNALDAIHAEGLVHRDIKPGNLIASVLGSEPAIRVVDFGSVGLAKTNTTLGLGTIDYIAPEQLFGEARAPSDLYSLGMTVLALVSGVPPSKFPRRRAWIDVRALPAKLPPELQSLLQDMVDEKPERRPQSAKEAAARLGKLGLAPRPAVAWSAPVPPTRAAPPAAQAASDDEPLALKARFVKQEFVPFNHVVVGESPGSLESVSSPRARCPVCSAVSWTQEPSCRRCGVRQEAILKLGWPPPSLANAARKTRPRPDEVRVMFQALQEIWKTRRMERLTEPAFRSLSAFSQKINSEWDELLGIQKSRRLEYISTDGKPQTIHLDADTVSIGRGTDNEIQLIEDLVSNHHAIVRRQGPTATVEDLKSTNGTTVNGTRVTSRVLLDEDVIIIGNTALVFRIAERNAPRLPPVVVKTKPREPVKKQHAPPGSQTLLEEEAIVSAEGPRPNKTPPQVKTVRNEDRKAPPAKAALAGNWTKVDDLECFVARGDRSGLGIRYLLLDGTIIGTEYVAVGTQFATWWVRRGGDDPIPKNSREASKRAAELTRPQRVVVEQQSGKAIVVAIEVDGLQLRAVTAAPLAPS